MGGQSFFDLNVKKNCGEVLNIINLKLFNQFVWKLTAKKEERSPKVYTWFMGGFSSRKRLNY